MKDKRIKNYLKIGVLLFVITFIFNSCVNDDIPIDSSTSFKESPFTMQMISNKEISENKKISKAIKKFSKNTSNQKDNVNNAEYDFTVNTDFSKYIESSDGTIHSYTFLIEREVDNGLLENLILTLQPDGTYLAEFAIYTFIDEDTMELRTIPLGNFDTTPYINKSFYLEICTTTMNCTQWMNYCFDCESENPIVFQECVTYTSETNCTIQFFNTPHFADLSPSGGGGGRSNNSGSGGGGGSNKWSNLVWTGNNHTIGNTISSPTVPLLTLIKPNQEPCLGITNLLGVTAIKQRIENFKKPQTLNLNYEKGFELVNNDNGNMSIIPNNGTPQNTSITVLVPEDGSKVVFIHTHYNGAKMSPLFTIEDIRTLNSLYQWRQYNNKTLTDLTVMVVSPAGVYAAVIKDYNKFSNIGNKLQTNKFNRFKRKYYEGYPEPADENLMPFADDIEKKLLEQFESYGLGLFKAKSDLSGWEELNLDNNNQTSPTPCN